MSPSITPSGGGGGGSQTAMEVAQVGGISVVGGTGANLPFSHSDGDTLLDYTDPTAPTVIAAGTYAFTLGLSATAAHADIAAETDLILAGAVFPAVWDLGLAVPTDGNSGAISAAAIAKLDDGASIKWFLDHSDNGVSIAFSPCSVLVVKLA